MKYLILIAGLACLIATNGNAQQEKTKDQSRKQEEVVVKLKGNAVPDVYIDGKKYSYEIVELLDQSKIESVSVIKDEQAIKEYNAPNGVILIKSVNNSDKEEIRIKSKKSDHTAPVIFIDGKRADKETLSKMSPDAIESINVFKGDEAIEKYNSPAGAIIVVTKQDK
jgi:uncharacterized alpha/beta hydrolase family protein